MRTPLLNLLLLPLISLPLSAALKRSDVVFMYQAGAEVYQAYGATVLAWGGRPTTEALEAAGSVKFFGSVGMVTEFSRYYEMEPATYESGLCRDLEGNPFKVPWLTDHQHKGIPFWWCCTSQPRFQKYIRQRVVEVIKAGAHGLHIDDHLGTAGSLWLGGCFCERCVAGFYEYLKAHAPTAQASEVNDFRATLRGWLSEAPGRRKEQHPLWRQWRVYHLRTAARFMGELKNLAQETAGRRISLSANSGILSAPHLADHATLDFFSAEIDHQASTKALSEHPVLAYRIADAMGKPLASTASGQDWAFIKEQNRPGLVTAWIALGYASGHSIMAPHRQWCYTKEKGTHWYQGPQETFAPIYRFARDSASLLDDYENAPDLVMAFSTETLDAAPGKLKTLTDTAGEKNLAFKLAIGSNDYLDHPLSAADFEGSLPILVVDRGSFSAADQGVLKALAAERVFEKPEEAFARCKPSVTCSSPQVRLFSRIHVEKRSAAIHLVNRNYVATDDAFAAISSPELRVYPERLGVKHPIKATWHSPFGPPKALAVHSVSANAEPAFTIQAPDLKTWGILHLE